MTPEAQDPGAPPEMIEVEVAYARPDAQRVLSLRVPMGTTLQQALEASGIDALFPEVDLHGQAVGIFGELVEDRDRVLEPHDRVELYRPLLMDPKEARRQRAERGRRFRRGR